MKLGRRPRMAAIAVAGVCAAAAVVWTAAGCGVRTSPRPPEDTVIRTGTIAAQRRADGRVEIRWKRPRRSADGLAVNDLAGFTVERSGTDGGYVDILTVAVDDNSKVRPQQSFRALDEHAPPSPVRYRVRAFDSYGQQGIPSPPAQVAATAVGTKDHARVPGTEGGEHDRAHVTAPPDRTHDHAPSDP